ncbi:DUF4282 domain-containing protein [Prosthecochloris sp. N3]|uniref:DUF4282 domain-containing protein n=1 Tax=Prosthecochloris ethylica TaxID=2743976 RepID=A0ABR9XPL2_9CHLB|nr:DUF4282 domain-containing protein [Prosthecochloris ethylica]MBF0586116.1 DUF4282 domain-containing protein [Prosthecochloris ethylica]MBF0635822.1 DUF4282 domain-containing protein [Prosthecochloris ethylica]NUK47502.1 DUF4282 domain-containing protein [Prosthecochloris ethylica]
MNTQGFFARLFDFSFSEFVSLQIVRYLYIIGVVMAAISALGMAFQAIGGMGNDFVGGLFQLLLSPIAFLLTCLVVRIALEALIATFRIAENTTRIVENLERDTKGKEI